MKRPTLPPGFYALATGRIYHSDDLRIVRIAGRWHVVVKAVWK